METGFKSIDGLIGGFQPGELITLSARPGMEATNFVLSIMANIGEQDRLNNSESVVLYFALAQSAKQLFERFQKIAGDGIEAPFRGSICDVEKCDEWLCRNLTKHISPLARDMNPDLIVIDHLELLPSRNDGSREKEIALWLSDFKEIAARYGVPILVVTELGEECEGKFILKSKHFRYSKDSIDKLGFLYHETDCRYEFCDDITVYYYLKDFNYRIGNVAILKFDPVRGRVVEKFHEMDDHGCK